MKAIKILTISIFMLTTIGVYGQIEDPDACTWPTDIEATAASYNAPSKSLHFSNHSPDVIAEFSNPFPITLVGIRNMHVQWYRCMGIMDIEVSPDELKNNTTGRITFELDFTDVSDYAYYKCKVTSGCQAYIDAEGNVTPVVNVYLVTFKYSQLPFLPPSPSTISNINVYPNPATDNLNIEFSAVNSNNKKITILDANGNILKDVRSANEKSLNIDVTMLRKGNYFLHVEEKGQKVVRQIYIN